MAPVAALILQFSTARAQDHVQETAPAPASRVLAARLTGRALTPDLSGGVAEVRLVFRLLPEEGVREIPIRGLALLGREPEEVTARLGETGAVEVRLDRGDGPVRTGTVRLAPAGARDTVNLTLDYRVSDAVDREGAGAYDLLLPLLLVDWPPEGAPQDMFGATVELPSGFGVWEAFPTVPRSVEERDGVRRHRLELQVVPALVRFRGDRGDPPLFTLGRWVDLGVGGLLLLLGGVGILALRRERG